MKLKFLIFRSIFNMMKLNRINLIITSLLVVLFISCGDDEKKSSNEVDTFQEKNAKNFSQKVDLSQVREVNLISKANDASINWMAFTTARNEINRIQNFTLQEVVNNSNNIFRSIEELQDSIPQDFQKTPIKARLNVLLTKAYLLEGEASKQPPSAKNIDSLSSNLYREFGNLKIQLNEVFLKSVEDFEFELDERIRKQDSIAELNKDTQTK